MKLSRSEKNDRTGEVEEKCRLSPVVLKSVLSRIARVLLTDSTVLIFGERGRGQEGTVRAAPPQALQNVPADRLSPSTAPVCRLLDCLGTVGLKRSVHGERSCDAWPPLTREGGTIFLDEVGDLPAETQILIVDQKESLNESVGSHPFPPNAPDHCRPPPQLGGLPMWRTFRLEPIYRLKFPVELPSLRDAR